MVPAVLHETLITVEELRDQRVSYGTGVQYGPIEDGAPVARFETVETGPNPYMKVDVSPEFGISFEQRSPGRGGDVIETLAEIRSYIASEVFEPLDAFL